MANQLGQLNCSANRKNTGFGTCFEDWKLIKGALIYDNPRVFTAEEIAALEATLIADAAADNKASRMFPIHKFVTPTDNTEDLIVQTFDYGAKIPVREGDNDWMFQFVDGGNCLNKAGRTHNGPGYVLFYDKAKKIMGYDYRGQLAAIPTQFIHFLPWKLATGSTTAAYMVRFVFESKYSNEEGQFIQAEFDPAEITGLKDIKMIVNSFNEDTGVANVTLQTLCGAENLYDTYNGQLDDLTLYSAVDQDGNEVTITAMAAVPGSKSFNITLDPADLPDAGGTVFLSGDAPSILTTAGVPGYEIVTVEIAIEGS